MLPRNHYANVGRASIHDYTAAPAAYRPTAWNKMLNDESAVRVGNEFDAPLSTGYFAILRENGDIGKRHGVSLYGDDLTAYRQPNWPANVVHALLVWIKLDMHLVDAMPLQP